MKGLKLWRIAGFVWLIFLSCAYFFPSDSLYAITIWPPFVWASFGFFAALPGIRKHRSKLQLLLLGAWIVFWLGFGDEKFWVSNRLYPVSKPDLVLVSLNCAGGSVDAAEEAFKVGADIILLQESPSKQEIQKLANKYMGSKATCIVGADASIICKGPASPGYRTSFYTEAIVRLPDLPPIFVGSARFSPPTFRLDYWNPDCWTDYASKRNEQIKQLWVAQIRFSSSMGSEISILGGDFNMPADREIDRMFRHYLFPFSRGSGYSAINSFPMVRIDQVWAGSFFGGTSEAVTTQYSDHRMIVCKMRIHGRR